METVKKVKTLSDILWERHLQKMEGFADRLNKAWTANRNRSIKFEVETGSIIGQCDCFYLEELECISKFCKENRLSFFIMYGHPDNKKTKIHIHELHTDDQRRERDSLKMKI